MPVDRVFKYWAFISYSHQDQKWAEWLHSTLERYPVPKRLVGRDSPNGKIPRRLFPIFRDRDELPGSSNLSETIAAALQQSCFLIVICSPNSVASRWVGEEIKTFKMLGREEFVLCLIVDGEPNATDNPECGLPECFPKALRFRLTAEGALTDQRTESIAADLRENKDGRSNAKLKLLAGLLDVGYDELRQRDRQRQIWQRVQVGLGSIAVLAAVAGAWQWQRLERIEKGRLDSIERYTEEGRQELLAEKPLRAAVYLSEAYRLGSRSVPLRHLLAQALQPADSEPVALVGHKGEVWLASFSPDGRRVVTAGWDGTARVWNATTGDQLGTHDHGKIASAVRFSPDGTRILSASWDRTAALWSAADGKLQASLEGHSEAALFATFSPDGTRIATASRDQTAKIWDSATGKVLKTLEGHSQSVVAAVFSPDGGRLVTASWDKTAKVWEVATGKLIATANGHQDRLFTAEFSPSGTQILTASRDRSAKIWNATNGKLIATLQGHAQAVLTAKFRPDGLNVLTASWDKTAKIWDAANAKLLASLDGHTQPVLFAAYSPDGARIVTASWDKTAKVWDANSGKLLTSLEGHSNIVYSASFSPDNTRVATASFDNTVKVWNVGLEARPSDQISAWVRCRVPWRLDAGTLISASPETDGCSASAALPSGN